MRPKIVGIDGAVREASKTRVLFGIVGDAIRARGGDFVSYSQRGLPLPMFDDDPETAQSPAVQALFTAAAGADGFVLCSPEYHGSMSGALKNCLDWLEFDPRVRPGGRVFGLIGGGGGLGNSGATLQMMMAVRALHGWVMPDVTVSVTNIGSAIDAGGLTEGQDAMRLRIESFAEKIVRYAEEFRLMRERLAA